MTTCLIFPPLVNTNFGSYYPSTAYLAGYLMANGILSHQLDLNETFAMYLLEDDVLRNIAERNYPFLKNVQETILPVVAARILYKNKAELFTPENRHKFRSEQSPFAFLLDQLSSLFRIDAELLDVDEVRLAELREFYTAFFKYADVITQVGTNSALIGISVPMGPQLFPATFLAAYLKENLTDIKIVGGGPAFSLMADSDVDIILSNEKAFDVIVKFDGEKPLLQLCRQVEGGMWFPEIVPACHFRSNGAFIHNPPIEGPKLSELPFPEYDSKILSRLVEPELGIIQARGCYWGKCSYCDFIELYDGSPKYRTKQVKNFVNELIYLNKAHGINRFSLITESLPPKFAMVLSEELIERGLQFRWNSFAMVHNKFTSNTFKKMKEAGCEYLIIGIESMNTRVLKLVNKASDLEQNIEYINDAHEAQLPLRLNLIPDLPSTTYEEALFSLQQFEALQDKIDTVAVFPFEATRSSEVGRFPELFSLEPNDDAKTIDGQAQYANNHAKVIDRAMTLEQREKIYDLYNNFADVLNLRKFKKEEPGVELSEIIYELPMWYYDFVPFDHQYTQFYNPIFRTAYKIPNAWVDTMRKIQSEFPTSQKNFYKAFPKLQSNEVFEILKANQFIVPKMESYL